MLRNFYYIDEKGKDQGLNGTFIFPRYLLCAASLTQRPISPKPFTRIG